MKKSQFAIVLVINAVALLVAAALVAFIITDRMNRPANAYVPDEPEVEPAVDATGLPILWAAPHFEYTNHDGRKISSDDMKGHVWIADFIFTRCTSACPVLTARLMILQRTITDPNVRFVSFTVDPDHDTPQVLAEYARTWSGDMSRWLLLATENETKLHETTLGMRVAAQRTNDPLDPILHTNKFLLIDGSGNVRGMYDSTDEESMKRLVEHTALLTASKTGAATNLNLPNAPTAKAGAEIYMALGCASCHTNDRIAPRLNGLVGRTVTLADKQTLTADRAYVRESILNPTAKTVAGYPQAMPGYQNHLTGTQVEALVEYIESLPADGAVAEAREIKVDPICHMDVSVDAETPRAEFEGQKYYFCAEACRIRFEKDPKRFLKKQ